MERGYEIRIRGRLDAVLMSELGDLEPEPAGSTTRLSLATDDQATLHGTMARLRDLGLVVESVTHDVGHADDPSSRTVEAQD